MSQSPTSPQPPIDVLQISRLGLLPGAGRRMDLYVSVDPFELGIHTYPATPDPMPVALDVSRTVSGGFVLRARGGVTLSGPCMRCLGPAAPAVSIDAMEVDQPGAEDEEFISPWVSHGDLDLSGWVREALVMALPPQVLCRPDCRGLCPVCGADLNADPEHHHAPERDHRFDKLSELDLG